MKHETTHWSGAESRLSRDLKGRFGDEAYAAEELVAELGAFSALILVSPLSRGPTMHLTTQANPVQKFQLQRGYPNE